MNSYRWRAARRDGSVVSGCVEAETAEMVGGLLHRQGLFTLDVTPLAEPPRRSGRVASRRELAIAFRSLAAQVAAGVPLEQALAATESVTRGRLQHEISDARGRLRQGMTLARALQDGAGHTMPPAVIGMLQAGERGSRLGPALQQVAAHLEQEAELFARVRQALAYPVLLALLGVVSLAVIGTVIVPRFAAMLADLGQDLPFATRMLMQLSAFLSRYLLMLALTAVAAAWSLHKLWQQPRVKRAVHRALLRIPVVGSLRQALSTAHVARALGGMLDVGMPILPALAAAAQAAGDLAVAERLARVGDHLARGDPVTQSLEREHALLPVAIQLFGVGERSGRLAEMASRAGDMASHEGERALKTLVTLIEPSLIVAFGGLVAFVAAALLQAVYSISPRAF